MIQRCKARCHKALDQVDEMLQSAHQALALEKEAQNELLLAEALVEKGRRNESADQIEEGLNLFKSLDGRCKNEELAKTVKSEYLRARKI